MERTGLEIAILAMAGRFPQAPTLEAFWTLLQNGVEAVSFFSAEELAAAGIPAGMLAQPNFVKAGAFLEDADLFDAEFFELSPREAEMIDPQQRLLLECAVQALERAGYAGTSRPVGVFAGTGQNSYLYNNLLSRPELVESVGPFALGLANERDFVATRIAYKLNLSGPAVTVQTACSTSLVAVHLACQSLLAGECDLALAGGASVKSPQKSGYLHHPGGITSPDGHCRAFDAGAQGTVSGQGAGVVVLKLLEDALADGDPIHAVIKGSAVNNDGSLKAGFTAPSRDGQARVIRAAQLRAGVDPDSIAYVEAHGTATPLGDPIEIAALTRAFRQGTSRRGFCALGSVKTNIGHLDAAAGIAGLVKTVLALEHGEIPPSLHFATPNPEIDFPASPFSVNTRLSPWPAEGGPRRAGVSSFGLGGTNAHVILEEAPAVEPSGPSRPWQVLRLSARSSRALERITDELADHLESHPGLDLADVAYTLRVGRRGFRHRRVVVAADTAEALSALRSRDARKVWTVEQEPEDRPVAFLLPGVGDQYPGMARGLYSAEPVFRSEIDRCAEILRPHLGLDLRQVLFEGGAESPEDRKGLDLRALLQRESASLPAGPLADTRIAQPAMFAVGYALARLFLSWGVRPQALLGYSLGEYTAACLAGVMKLDDALPLVARRARLIAGLPAGAMLAVPLAEDEAEERLGPELSIAAVNGPALSVVSGSQAAVSALEQRLANEGVTCRRLPIGAAFHSRMMEAVAAPLEEMLRSIELLPPQIPCLSNVTGTWLRGDEATDPGYWVKHLCGTVRFADGVRELWREPGRILLELGPGQTLGSVALQSLPDDGAASRTVVSSLRHALDRQPDQAFLLGALGRLWLAGAGTDEAGFSAGERRRRVHLPTYPFERQRFWIERRNDQTGAARTAAPAGRLADMADWFHAPSFRRTTVPASPGPAGDTGTWLVLLDELGVGDLLVEHLRSAGCRVATVRAGAAFSRPSEWSYTVAPGMNDGWEALLASLEPPPERIVHLWSLTPPGGRPDLAEAQDRGFYSLLSLAQAVGRTGASSAISVVANGICGVERGDPVHPEKATLLGPVQVIPRESPRIACRLIDVDPEEIGNGLEERLARELARTGAEPVVACRGAHRWSPALEAVRLEAGDRQPVRLRDEGVYLVTGGLGGIGLALAGHLARTVRAPKLVLIGRSGLLERSLWETELALAGEGDLARKIREVQALEQAGAEVLILRADVANREEMRWAVAEARERFGRIDGVFHAAGLPGAGLAQLKTKEEAARVLAPKVQGTQVLHEALGGQRPDFVVLFSSIAAITGGVGQVDYSAANAFLDAFARAEAGTATFSVDWGEWQWDSWTGTLVADPEVRQRLRRSREIYGLTFAEGFEALRRILASGLPQVVVSTHRLDAAVEAPHSLPDVVGELDVLSRTRKPTEHPRPSLGTPYLAPRGDAEERLVALWEELLGILPIGVQDNFFQLGGHSLLGLQLVSRIHASFGIELPLRTVFEAPTVEELALALEAAGDRPASPLLEEIGNALPADPREVLKRLDQLSEDDMDELLSQMLAGEEEPE
ncbi:MAG TPA: SDR family NAD(P)-dependent oxidoreductase [Thermoanaerobaculia bacterium]|nr:SDR family NAD(P)-dependent oxidoreductase [Thermoanaerobaculia bacterium]